MIMGCLLNDICLDVTTESVLQTEKEEMW